MEHKDQTCGRAASLSNLLNLGSRWHGLVWLGVSMLWLQTLGLRPVRASESTDAPPSHTIETHPASPSTEALNAADPEKSNGSLWLWTGAIRTEAGYRDNLLYSRDAREKSSALGGSGEFTVTRIPTGRWRWQSLASAEGFLFPSGKTVRREIQAFVHTELRYDFNPSWSGTLEGQYGFQDLVFDATLTETNQTSLPIQAHPFHLNPGVRWEHRSGWWVHFKANLERMNFRQSELDGYDQVGPVLEWGRNWPERTQLTFKSEFLARLYDHRVTYSALGQPDGLERLQYSIVSTEALWKQNLGDSGRWQNTVRLGAQFTMDNGSGYFDYSRYTLTEGIGFRTRRWDIQVRAGIRHYHYDLQLGDAVDERRYRTVLTAGAQLEYRFARNFFAHARYDWEDNRTNLGLDRYRLSLVSSGLGWEF